nr:SMP-30/gluconolactonase/LRE family protein [uncultured Roseateles sp.]
MIPNLASNRLSLVFAQTAILGECLQWHAGSGRWWWTDIESSLLHAWTPASDAALSCRLPDRLGCFAHTRSGRLLLGLAKSLCLADLDDLQATGATLARLTPLAAVDAREPHNRINDGRTDRRGYFVFGTINEEPVRRPIGGFYQYSMRHGLRPLALPAVAIANSICFSLDGRTLYFCDTLSRTLQQCDYDAESAQVAGIRPFVAVSDRHAWPDGSVIDAEGCLWNAQWGAGQIVRYGPDGALLQRFSVPAKHSSCPALGGVQGDQLMVTTARQELSPEQLLAMPLSGSLFGLQLPRALAQPDALFDDQAA